MTQVEFTFSITNQYQPLKGYAYRLTQNTEEAEDLVQDTMYKALSNHDKFESGTNLKGWLYTIMKNIFINKYRRARKSNIVSDDTDNQFYINNASYTSTNGAATSLALKDINKAIGKLTDNLKVPFLMSFSGYKYDEISRKLSIPLGTVKIRIHCARKKLQESLYNYGMDYDLKLS